MKIFKGKCRQTIIEDNEIQFESGEVYELVHYDGGEIQGRTEHGLYLTVSDSGDWKFKNYFSNCQIKDVFY